MESRSALFNMFEKSGGEEVSLKHGGFTQIVDPHVINNGEDEGGGVADARVTEGVILNAYFPDGLKFLGLVNVVLQDGGIGANVLGRGKSLAIICCVGVRRGDDSPEVVFCMGLVVACLEEEGCKRLADTNNVVVGGIPCDWNEGLSGLCQLEGELFGRHSAAFMAAAAWVALATSGR